MLEEEAERGIWPAVDTSKIKSLASKRDFLTVSVFCDLEPELEDRSRPNDCKNVGKIYYKIQKYITKMTYVRYFVFV